MRKDSVSDAAIALVESILRNARHYEWTLQGLGMLRTYLTTDRSFRLHVWDDRFATEEVSVWHTHPWDMTSTVISGCVVNDKYRHYHAAEARFMEQSVFCGEGGGLEGEPREVGLELYSSIAYHAGESYSQTSDEIHVSRPHRGTVTVVEREFLSDVDHAYVLWPKGLEWVSAEPRAATPDEVQAIVSEALRRF